MTHIVLFLDDEQMVLESINRTLHREPYLVKTADNSDNALKLITETPPSVIVSDMNMPFMDGNEFLSKAQKICPDAVYMVLSAYSEIEKIMKAVNEQHVWRYITKPWQKEDLKLAVNNAIEIFQHRKDKMNLLLKLEEQNKKLLQSNDVLEKKVRERTIQLLEKNEILQMLIEGNDMRLILNKICKVISGQLMTSPVFIDVPFLNNTFSDVTRSFTDNLRKMSGDSIVSRKEILTDSAICVPLIRNDTALGTMHVLNTQNISNDQLIDILNSFVPTVIICLIQALNLQQVDNLMDEILPV